MKNKDYLKTLTPEVGIPFVSNFIKQRSIEAFEMYMELPFKDTHNFYAGAFKWSSTPEGHEFWASQVDKKDLQKGVRLFLLEWAVIILGLITVARIIYSFILK